MKRRYLPAGVLLTLVLIVGVGCDPATEPTQTTDSTVMATTGAPTTGSPEMTTSAAESAEFHWSTSRFVENRGTVSVDLSVPEVTSGPAAARTAFNAAIDAGVQQIFPGSMGEVTVRDGELIDRQRTRVTTAGPRVVAGVMIMSSYMKGAAHPINVVNTVVIRADNAKPITYEDVFASPTAAAGQLATIVMTVDDRVGHVEPTVENFRAWIPSGDGMHFYIPVSHALGDYLPVTVSWSAIKNMLRHDMHTVLAS